MSRIRKRKKKMLKNIYDCGGAFYSYTGSEHDGKIFFMLLFTELTSPQKRLKYILEKLGFIVEVIIINPANWKENFRRASLLGDFVYVERDYLIDEDDCPDYFNYWENLELPPIEPEKDINAVLGPWSYFTSCRCRGLMTYLLYCGFNFNGAHVVVQEQGSEIVDKLCAAGATVTVVNQYTHNKSLIMREADLIITSPGTNGFKINCYPYMCPIIDMKDWCINTEDRDVQTNCAWVFEVIGVLSQLW